MASQQPPARPWFRLATMARPPPDPTPAPAPQAQPPAPLPRPPFIRPTFTQTFVTPTTQPAVLPRSPPPPPQEPAPPPPPPPAPQAPAASPPAAAVFPTPTPAPQPAPSPPRPPAAAAAFPPSPPSPPAAAVFPTPTPAPQPAPSPPSPPPAAAFPPSPPPPQPAPSPPRPAASSPPLAPAPQPPAPSPVRSLWAAFAAPPPTATTSSAPSPKASPPIPTIPYAAPSVPPAAPIPVADAAAPTTTTRVPFSYAVIKPRLSPPPSPLTLPPAQYVEHEAKIPPEVEQKTVLVQETIEKPKVMPRTTNGDLQSRVGENFALYGKRDVTKDSGNHKKLSDSEEFGMRVITIAGENKGAIMEFSPSRKKQHDFGGKPQILHKRSGSDSGSSNEEEGRLKIKDNNNSPNAMANLSPPLNAYMNSNVQGVNNSILCNFSCTQHDPGVHLSLSRKANGIHIKDRMDGQHI